jgi:hypothetical protein
MAQYVSMTPVGDERTRAERIHCWEYNEPPSGWAFGGDPRKLEQKNMPAELTKLGGRLLGKTKWEREELT